VCHAVGALQSASSPTEHSVSATVSSVRPLPAIVLRRGPGHVVGKRLSESEAMPTVDPVRSPVPTPPLVVSVAPSSIAGRAGARGYRAFHVVSRLCGVKNA
jgi:hypothetical protein